MRRIIGEALLYVAALIEGLAIRVGGVEIASQYLASHRNPQL